MPWYQKTNRTVSFIGRAGKFGIEFMTGVVEEVTLNITGTGAAHAAEISEDVNVKFISKEKLITSTSTLAASKLLRTQVFDIISHATPNLIV